MGMAYVVSVGAGFISLFGLPLVALHIYCFYALVFTEKSPFVYFWLTSATEVGMLLIRDLIANDLGPLEEYGGLMFLFHIFLISYLVRRWMHLRLLRNVQED